jgi:DNA-binding NarL/FixJ family response regulator
VKNRVAIAASLGIVGAGIEAILRSDPGVEVVAIVDDGDQLLNVVQELNTDVVVVDAHLNANWSAVEECVKAWPVRGRLVAVLHQADPQTLAWCCRIGVRGIVAATASGNDLQRFVRIVSGGGSVVDPRLSGRIIRLLKTRSLELRVTLSARESEVMHLVACGHSTAEIARSTGLRPATIRTYIRRALEKLSARNRSEGAARFVELEAQLVPRS